MIGRALLRYYTLIYALFLPLFNSLTSFWEKLMIWQGLVDASAAVRGGAVISITWSVSKLASEFSCWLHEGVLNLSIALWLYTSCPGISSQLLRRSWSLKPATPD